MIGPVFVDTNVFVYARDASEPAKQPVAREWIERLWRDQSGRTSVQVLSEYYVTVTRKLSPGLTAEEAWDDVETLLAWHPAPVDPGLMRRGHEVQSRFRLSWWDSLVIAAAQRSGCLLLLSGDLQDGGHYSGVTVRNPFQLRISEFAETYTTAPKTRVYRGRGRPRKGS